MTLARVAVSTWLLAGLAQVPPTTSQRTWPPPGVLSPGDDVSAPEIVSRVAPDYPPQLQIRRLQGFVTLQFVVEPDGTVGPVRVVAPLDVYLDGAAVAAVRQWRFKPGTKNGLAVRVAAQAVMTFTLRGEPPPMTLPEGFASGGDTSIAVWNDETVETTDTTIRLAYPAGWRRAASSSTAVTVADPHSMHSFGVMRPMTLPVPLPFPMPLNELARFSELMRARFADQDRATTIRAVGQSHLGRANWLWLELEASSAFPTDVFVPPAIRDTIAGARVWAFITTIGSRLVQTMCVAPLVTGETPTQEAASLAAMRAECFGILDRIALTPR